MLFESESMGNKSVKKLISIVVPVYNEQDCLEELYRRTSAVMNSIIAYDIELVFFDDGSTDASREMIESFCKKDNRCKAVFLSQNCGYNSVIFYAIQQAKGDCVVLVHADLQNPPELIPAFIHEWEQGHDVVFGVKNKSHENKLMYFIRTLFYWIMNLVFGMGLIPHATDFELIDKSIIASLQSVRQSEPVLRLLLPARARNKKILYYTQDKRFAGESNFTVKKYYELAVSWIAASPAVLPRRFLCVGLVLFAACLIELFAGFLPHITQWSYQAVSTPLMVRIGLILLSVMICFAAVMSEMLIGAKNKAGSAVCIEERERINY